MGRRAPASHRGPVQPASKKMRRGVVHWSTPEPTCSDRRSDPRNVRFRRFCALSVWTTPRRRGGPVDPAPGPGWSTPSRALDRSSAGEKRFGVRVQVHEFRPPCPKTEKKCFHHIISACCGWRALAPKVFEWVGWSAWMFPTGYGRIDAFRAPHGQPTQHRSVAVSHLARTSL